MTTTIKATSDGLSGELQVNGAPALRYGADTSGQMPGFRNKIINGKMEIAQRGTSFPAIAVSTYSLDRWFFSGAGTDAVITVSQSSDAPSGNEFQYSLRHTVTTADTSIAAAQSCVLQQRIEGYNARDLIGRTFTLSFWVRSSKPGIYCTSFTNSIADRSYITEYTINSANTWEYKTITVSGGLITAGTWDWTNGIGLTVRFTLACGSNYQSTAGSWLSSGANSTANQVNCLDTVGNIFAITGVQLEAGSIATPFEHRPYGTELALCQRYYWALRGGVGVRAYQNTGAALYINAKTPVTMRIAPSSTSIVGTWTTQNCNQPTFSPLSSPDFMFLSSTTTATGDCACYTGNNTVGFNFDAEL